MTTLKDLDKVVLNGTAITNQKFPGKILVPAHTVNEGVILQQVGILNLKVAVNDALQVVHILFFLDGVLYNDWVPSYTPLQLFSFSPGVVGFVTYLFVGNDGFLYQYQKLIEDPPALTEFLLNGNADTASYNGLFGPTDITQLANTGIGSSRQPILFDPAVPHVFELGFRNEVTQPLNTAAKLISQVRIFQAPEGNTAG